MHMHVHIQQVQCSKLLFFAILINLSDKLNERPQAAFYKKNNNK